MYLLNPDLISVFISGDAQWEAWQIRNILLRTLDLDTPLFYWWIRTERQIEGLRQLSSESSLFGEAYFGVVHGIYSSLVSCLLSCIL